MSRRFRATPPLLLCILPSLCCCEQKTTEDWSAAPLSEGVLARVGPLILAREDVELWPSGQRPELAVLISDTLLSIESMRVAPHRAEVIRRGALSRAVLEHMEKEQLAAKPLSAEEIAKTRSEHWLSFDRPRAVRTAVVRIPVDPLADDGPYLALAEQLHTAAESSHNIESLLSALDSVQTQYEVQKMRMPPVAEDGKVVPLIPQDHEIARLDPLFARQATLLSHPGELSPVFATSDAYQFLFATEIVGEARATTEAQRAKLEKLAVARRISDRVDGIVDRQGSDVTYARRDVSSLLKLVWRE